MEEKNFYEKINFLTKINEYARSICPIILNITISLSIEHQVIEWLKADGYKCQDVRPLFHFNIQILIEKDNKKEIGRSGAGGRYTLYALFEDSFWQFHTQEALRKAKLNLNAFPAPAGIFPVILGPGWPGVMLHEAIGHGLEGDFNRKKTSAFSDLKGQKIAADFVTVLDDATLNNKRGSLTIDDEGTIGQKTLLVENGILVNYMQDRLNARLMKDAPTGNGRRQSYRHVPLPRMTNTYMINGPHTQEEMIKSTKEGVLALDFNGGQVDITSGSFVFEASEAYKIENGQIIHPIKGMTLIGHGPEALKKIKMLGSDMALDSGIGTCGKEGQSLPVGVGQPSMLITEMTVGGTELSKK